MLEVTFLCPHIDRSGPYSFWAVHLSVYLSTKTFKFSRLVERQTMFSASFERNVYYKHIVISCFVTIFWDMFLNSEGNE